MKYVTLLIVLAACGNKGSPRTYYYGRDGIDGKSGSNAVVSMVSFSGVSGSCTNGGITLLTATDSNASGALDSGDFNLLSSTICNGEDGLDGTDGEDGEDAPVNSFIPVAILDPCGNHPNYYDEVMLKLYNGQVLSSFSDNASGLNTRFSILGAGSYRTTDGSNCHFSIDNSGNLYNEHY